MRSFGSRLNLGVFYTSGAPVHLFIQVDLRLQLWLILMTSHGAWVDEKAQQQPDFKEHVSPRVYTDFVTN